MKEKPIIFSTDMAKAILTGEKTQTRRVIKPQPINSNKSLKQPNNKWFFPNAYYNDLNHPEIGQYRECLYQIGQTLWVRETWSKIYIDWPPEENTKYEYEYKADTGNKYPGEWPEEYKDDEACGRWKPSIFMPREAARIFLKIKNIRVERIQDISEQDAIKEGVDAVTMADHPRQATMSRKADFKQLWDSINKKRGFGWDVNTWVWVIEFERIKL